jgi:NET1-associated nuclear protein 1 (U3 small nucleolar RNA-associated protein 17)
LLIFTVAWSNTSHAYTHLIAHPSASLFITAHYPEKSSCTVISVWSPTSSKAVPGHRIPHTLRDLVLLPAPASTSADPAKSLNFIGVASSGEILRFGESVSPTATGTQEIKLGEKKSNSVWQEMFGKDAFIDVSSLGADSAHVDEIRRGRTRGTKGKPADVFEGPSHTLPPVGLLFNAFMEEILGEPSTAAKPDLEGVHGDEEIVFDETDRNEVASVVEQKVKGKVVGDDEVRELEVLFREVLANSELLPATDGSESPC